MGRRAALPFDTLIVDRNGATSLSRQVFDLIQRHIVGGQLPVGTRLPSTRTLAQQLSIGRNTALAAYEQLQAEGYVDAGTGSGTWVAFSPKRGRARPDTTDVGVSRRGALLAREPQPVRSPGKLDLYPGYPDPSAFPYAAWGRLLARNARKRGGDMIGYYDHAGHPRLRAAIATYVGVSRGVDCTPEQVIVVTGAQAALDLASRILLDDGDCVWMEDPGYLGARSALLGSGAHLAPLKVDRTGWHIGDPELPPPRAIYVTPSCQWPLGRSMSAAERDALLSVAEQHRAWILEDDYDGEYRLRGHPVPAVAGFDRANRVIYIGSFGKTLFSSLRIGFLIVPPVLSRIFSQALSITGQFAPLLLQATLADFLQEGHFASHLKRTRRLYARRQSALVALCRETLSRWLEVEEGDAGMQVNARLLPPWDDRAVAAAALRHGVDVQPVSINFRHDPAEYGLLLGFARLNETMMAAAVAGLEATFRDMEAMTGPNGSIGKAALGSRTPGQTG